MWLMRWLLIGHMVMAYAQYTVITQYSGRLSSSHRHSHMVSTGTVYEKLFFTKKHVFLGKNLF